MIFLDKSAKCFLSIITALLIFIFSKDLMVSIIAGVWIFFLLFSLPYQLFLVISVFLSLYVLLSKSINIIYPIAFIILGITLSFLQKINGNKLAENTNEMKQERRKIMTLSLVVIITFFILAVAYREYQADKNREEQKELSIPNISVNLK